ncbi:MAG: rhomboid family intramembrane serine protease [Candidatus Krumholzibacteriota bacterium]|nr:rhomboid family intramembrane serine protease [Candidatus Krumholzibacteriota bacterium]
MENANETFTIFLIVANVIFSLKGFSSRRFFEQYLFNVERILRGGEYIRILTSGFLHANIGHLMFNMIALYSFSLGVGARFGFLAYLGIYFGSLIAGNLLALYIHRDHPGYRAIGASGAVSGVIYSSIIIFPHGGISFLLFPVSIPSWLFGILFILVSVYGIRAKLGNIGHEAHLGGAIAGIIISVALRPRLLMAHPFLISMLLILTTGFLLILVHRPDILRIRKD